MKCNTCKNGAYCTFMGITEENCDRYEWNGMISAKAIMDILPDGEIKEFIINAIYEEQANGNNEA